MIKKTYIAGLGMLLFLAAFSFSGNKKTYVIAGDESVLTWTGKRMTYGHTGSIDLQSGELYLEGNNITGGEFVIDMTSIRDLDITDEKKNSKLTNHLKSADFFEVETYPTTTFVITSARLSPSAKGSYHIEGDLTIKGVTNSIAFIAVVEQSDTKLKVTGTITFDRSKFKVKYGSGSFFDDLGDKVIHDDIQLTAMLVGYLKQ
jgi:polyisoprenoid-binding protein YceI